MNLKYYCLILVICSQSCAISSNSTPTNTQDSITYKHKTWCEIPKTTCEYNYEDHDIIARLDPIFRMKYVLGVSINGLKVYQCDICKFLKEFKAKPFRRPSTWMSYRDANNFPRVELEVHNHIPPPKIRRNF
jgi:hypothetical protein